MIPLLERKPWSTFPILNQRAEYSSLFCLLFALLVDSTNFLVFSNMSATWTVLATAALICSAQAAYVGKNKAMPSFLFLLGQFCACCVIPVSLAWGVPKRNLTCMLGDDIGWADFGYNNGTQVARMQVDQDLIMAAERTLRILTSGPKPRVQLSCKTSTLVVPCAAPLEPPFLLEGITFG